MRKKILIVIADGSEDIEIVTPIDILRRAGAEITVAAIENLEITASCKTKIVADALLHDCVNNIYDMIIVPGGMPGVNYLRDSAMLTKMLSEQNKAKRLLAGICAAPVVVFQHHGLLVDKKATCHPSMFDQMLNLQKDLVVVDDNIITSQAPGTALLFSLKLVEILFGSTIAQTIAKAVVMI